MYIWILFGKLKTVIKQTTYASEGFTVKFGQVVWRARTQPFGRGGGGVIFVTMWTFQTSIGTSHFNGGGGWTGVSVRPWFSFCTLPQKACFFSGPHLIAVSDSVDPPRKCRYNYMLTYFGRFLDGFCPTPRRKYFLWPPSFFFFFFKLLLQAVHFLWTPLWNTSPPAPVKNDWSLMWVPIGVQPLWGGGMLPR